jgi:hypothetical protein
MGAQQCRPDFDAARYRQTAGCAQHLQLVRGIESVTGLDLDGGNALGDQALQPDRALRYQLVFAGGTRGAHVEAIPPPALAMSSYDAPASRISNSSARLAA